jgi:hypothetical protein
MILSTNTTPIPAGPRQYVYSLSFSYVVAPKVTQSWYGALQAYVVNTDGSNPLPLGGAVALASDAAPSPNVPADPAAVTLRAAIDAAIQAYVTAKSL